MGKFCIILYYARVINTQLIPLGISFPLWTGGERHVTFIFSKLRNVKFIAHAHLTYFLVCSNKRVLCKLSKLIHNYNLKQTLLFSSLHRGVSTLVIQKYTKIVNFVRLYFSYFSIFCNKTLQFY